MVKYHEMMSDHAILQVGHKVWKHRLKSFCHILNIIILVIIYYVSKFGGVWKVRNEVERHVVCGQISGYDGSEKHKLYCSILFLQRCVCLHNVCTVKERT